MVEWLEPVSIPKLNVIRVIKHMTWHYIIEKYVLQYERNKIPINIKHIWVYFMSAEMLNQSFYLQKAISNQSHQQLVSVLLPDDRSVFRRIHAGEVEHGHVGLRVVVHGVVQRRQLVVGAEVGGLAGVGEQSLLIDVVAVQESLCLDVILIEERK